MFQSRCFDHGLFRQILGLCPVRAAHEKPFHYKTLSENVCHLDEELLGQINAIVVAAGRPLFKKNGAAAAEPIRAKADSYVLETKVHYPTDLNLLWDGQRKCADLLAPLARRYQMAGWRKTADWRRKLKTQMISLTRLLCGGGPKKEQRSRAATQAYVQASYRFEEKVFATLQALPAPQSVSELVQREQVDYFHTMMIKQALRGLGGSGLQPAQDWPPITPAPWHRDWGGVPVGSGGLKKDCFVTKEEVKGR